MKEFMFLIGQPGPQGLDFDKAAITRVKSINIKDPHIIRIFDFNKKKIREIIRNDPQNNKDEQRDLSGLKMTNIYRRIMDSQSQSLMEFHLFSHSTFRRPLLNMNDVDSDQNPKPEGADFDEGNMPATDRSKFAAAFAPNALVKIYGCIHEDNTKDQIIEAMRIQNEKEKLRLKNDLKERIVKHSYPFRFAEAAIMSVFAAPVGVGADQTKDGRQFFIPTFRLARFQLFFEFYKTLFKARFDEQGYMEYSSKLKDV